MELSEPHVYRSNMDAFKEVCVCGKSFLDPIHIPAIRKVARGVIKPTYISRPRQPWDRR